MKLDKLKGVVASVAPGLATALGGPLAGAAVAAVSKAVLGKTNATEDELLAAVSGITPEQQAALHEAELEFKKEMGRQGIQLVELTHQNTADAREMQTVALQQGDSFAKRFVYYFAIGWSLFAMGYITAITFIAIPQESVRFADTVQGFILGTLIATIMNFFYGSSYSSRKKDETMAELSKMP
jgi:hypothetical protein